MNAVKHTVYSSMYVVVAFFEQMVVLELIDELTEGFLNILLGIISILVMVIVLKILCNILKKQIEETQYYQEPINNKWIECATQLSYFSPVLCVIDWILSRITSDIILDKVCTILIILFTIVMPLVVKKNEKVD